MIDMSKLSQDFMPRRRRLEEGFAPHGYPQQGWTTMPARAQAGQQVSTGQPQPFAPVGGQPPTGGYGGGQTPQIAYPPQPPPMTDALGWEVPGGEYIGEGPGFGQGRQPPAGGGGFPYPEQWGTATDIYGKLAGGMPAMPDPGAMWAPYRQEAEDLSRELAEQAGMGMGTRYGSALGRNIADVGMRAGERFGGEMERMRMGDIAGQRQAMLGAASGLGGLGGQYAQLPGQLAGQAMGLGGQYQGMQQQEYDRMLQEFMRTQPEYSPYLPYMQQGAQVPYGPQTYSPGFGSNMMDLSGMLGMYSYLNPGGGQQSWFTRPW